MRLNAPGLVSSEAKRRFILNVSVLTAFAAVTAVICLYHEPWRDEAEIWLFGRDLDLVGLVRHMAVYAGAPSTWALVNFVLAKAGFPYASIFVLHWLIAVAAVAVLLFYAPLGTATKVLFAFSYIMAYEYVVVARHYGLGVLTLFAALALWPVRRRYPIWLAVLVLLLFNTNTHMLAAAFFFLVFFAFECIRERPVSRRHYVALAIMGAGLGLLLLQVVPSITSPIRSVTVVPETLDKIGLTALLALISGFGWNDAMSGSGLLAVQIAGIPAFLLVAAVLYVLLLLPLRRHRLALIFVAFTHIWLFYVFTRVYYGAPRHHGLLLVFLIGAHWLAASGAAGDGPVEKRRRPASWLLHVALLPGIVLAITTFTNEVRYSYSGGREAADFIRRQGLAQDTIVVYPPWTALSLLPYLPRAAVWHPDRHEFGTFLRPDDDYFRNNYRIVNGALVARITHHDVVRDADRFFPCTRDLLLLLGRPLEGEDGKRFEPLFRTTQRVTVAKDEVYFLYRRRLPPAGSACAA